MCGLFDRLGVSVPKKELDRLHREDYIAPVRTKRPSMGPGDVFKLRTKMSMTQVEFGRAVGVDPITVSRWERGETKVSTAYAVLIRKTIDDLQEAGVR